MFVDKRHFREFLQSEEAISSNILADRLKVLLEYGLVTRSEDPSHKQKAIYSLTEAGIAMLPILVQIGIWARKYCPVTKRSGAHGAALEKGGPRLWDELALRLRQSLVRKELGTLTAPHPPLRPGECVAVSELLRHPIGVEARP